MRQNTKDWDTFLFPFIYAYTVQVYQTTKLPRFSLEVTLLPPGPIAIVCPMPPDVVEVDSTLVYTLRLIRRTALFEKMADKNSKKTQVQCMKENSTHIRFEPHFKVDDYVFVKRLPLKAPAANRMAFEVYSELLSCSTGPYQVICAETE